MGWTIISGVTEVGGVNPEERVVVVGRFEEKAGKQVRPQVAL